MLPGSRRARARTHSQAPRADGGHPDHRPHCQERGGRSDRRPRTGRRRLHHQAVQPARGGARVNAVLRRARPTDTDPGAPPTDAHWLGWACCGSIPRVIACSSRGEEVLAHPRPSSGCCASCWSERAACPAAVSSAPTSGARRGSGQPHRGDPHPPPAQEARETRATASRPWRHRLSAAPMSRGIAPETASKPLPLDRH